MKRRITFVVYPTNATSNTIGCKENEHTFASAMTNFSKFMRGIGESIPATKYKVAYTLAPKTGRLRAYKSSWSTLSHTFLEPFEPRGDGEKWVPPIVCQLPKEWDGVRVNRKTQVLP